MKAPIQRGWAAGRFDAWLFDLDNTLYHHSCDLFAQMDARMQDFICATLGVDREQARLLQKGYFHSYGTTLRGLMDEHGVDPRRFIDFVHEIDVTVVPASPVLGAILARLPGRKIVFTNGSVRHAENVMARLGVAHHFHAVFDIEAAGYVPKPAEASYRRIVERFRLDAARTLMLDDAARNLKPAAALGMTTVWVRTQSVYGCEGSDGDHVHHVADDVAAWLETALGDTGTGEAARR